jgi:hypothetical protein
LEVEHRERVRKILEESESTSSGRIVPFVLAVGKDPGRDQIGWSLGSRRIPQEEKNRRLEIAVENREAPQIVRSRRRGEGFNP